jgi:hypothetical protein
VSSPNSILNVTLSIASPDSNIVFDHIKASKMDKHCVTGSTRHLGPHYSELECYHYLVRFTQFIYAATPFDVRNLGDCSKSSIILTISYFLTWGP